MQQYPATLRTCARCSAPFTDRDLDRCGVTDLDEQCSPCNETIRRWVYSDLTRDLPHLWRYWLRRNCAVAE